MVRKNCNSNHNESNESNELYDLPSGHSEIKKIKFFFVVSSNFNLLFNLSFNYCYFLGARAFNLLKNLLKFFEKNIFSYIKYCFTVLFFYFNRFIKNSIRKFKAYLWSFRSNITEPVLQFIKIYKITKIDFRNKNKKFLNIFKVFFSTFRQYRKDNKVLISHFMNYVYPVFGLSILITCIAIVNSWDYGLSVVCFNKHIGYVDDEYVFLDASKQMNSRINYNEDQQPINDTPTYTLVKLDGNIKCDNKDDIADKLLKASDKIITKASGLYINDNFIGAIKENKKLQNVVDSYLDPYKQKYPDDEVTFVDDVVVRKGYYLTDSLCELETISQKISKGIDEQIIYTVQKGDVPQTIAAKNCVPYSQLKQLNPDIEQDLKPGQKIVVSQSKPMLSVKVTRVNSVNEEIPFEVEQREDANITNSYKKMTQSGKNGIVERKYKTILIDGIETEHTLVSENVISRPISEKWLIGTKNIVLKSFNNNNSGISQTNLLFPVDGGKISCGWYGYKGHTGTDISAPSGTPIRSVADGKVIFAGWKGAYGNCVLVDIGNNIIIRYAHNSKNLVNVGDFVNRGQQIAQVGQTGHAFGAHCHFEVIINGSPKNPELYLNK